MARIHLYLLVALLTAVGLSAFYYKAFHLNFPLRSGTTSTVWNVEASVSFTGRGQPLKVSLLIPRSDRTTLITDENFISPGYGLTTSSRGVNRQATWSVRRADGRHSVFYRATVRLLAEDAPEVALPPARTLVPEVSEARQVALKTVADEIRQLSADLDSFVQNLLRRLRTSPPPENVRLLVGSELNNQRVLQAAAEVLQTAGIPARLAHGVRLTTHQRRAEVERWLEIYSGGKWERYWPGGEEDPPSGEYLVWWRGDLPLVDVTGASRYHAELFVSRAQEEAIESALYHASVAGKALVDYSLFALPLRAQGVYRILLFIPLGGLLVVFCRTVIGIKTFGTFMPVLIAMAFRETALLSGLVFFTVLLALGVAVRFYLAHLRLLLVARLSVLLAVIVLLMAAISIITFRLGIEHGLSVALFPMVILAMTIERMSVVWEESGAQDALLQAAGTILVAVLTFAVMSWETARHLVFVFPELLLPVIGLMLLLGRYSGYRLLELRRFRALNKELA